MRGIPFMEAFLECKETKTRFRQYKAKQASSDFRIGRGTAECIFQKEELRKHINAAKRKRVRNKNYVGFSGGLAK